jgi:hypothetical protein
MAKATGAKRGRPRGKPRGPAKPRARRKPKWTHPSYGIRSRIRSVCAGRTFDELSRATGVHGETVRRQVRGLSRPNVEFITALCMAYGISGTWLLCGLGPRRLRR